MALYLHFVNKNVFVFCVFVAFNENILCVLFYFTKTRTAKRPACLTAAERLSLYLQSSYFSDIKDGIDIFTCFLRSSAHIFSAGFLLLSWGLFTCVLYRLPASFMRSFAYLLFQASCFFHALFYLSSFSGSLLLSCALLLIFFFRLPASFMRSFTYLLFQASCLYSMRSSALTSFGMSFSQ